MTKESDGLIFSPRKGAKTGGFVVALDEELLASIEQARRASEGDAFVLESEPVAGPARAQRPTSSLSPREIQARLRSGATIAEVAVQAGVGQDWVLRFADPILAEQAQVVESAQRLVFAKSRLGPSVEPLAESVQWNLSDRGVRISDDVFANGWSAFNLHGTRWAVRFHYTSRQRHQMAEWEVDLRERTLSARNRLASDLGHVEAGRRRPRLEPLEHGQGADPPALPAPAATGRKPGRKAVAAARPGKAAKAPATAKVPTAKATRTTKAAKPAGPVVKVAKAQKPARAAGPVVKVAKAPSAAPPAAKATTATKAQKAGLPAAKAAPATKATKAAKASPAAKRASRESSPRKSRPAKKPAAETPPDPLAERPTHLARPPSPMNMANKATSMPGHRFASPYARPAPARPPAPPRDEAPRRPPPPPPPPPPPEPMVDDAWSDEEDQPAPSPVFDLREPLEDEPPPARPRPTAAKSRPATRPAAKAVAPPLPRPPVREGGGDDDRPAVVILPSPPPEAPGPGAARATGRGTPRRTTPSRRVGSG